MVATTRTETRAAFAKRLNKAIEELTDAPVRGRSAWMANRYRDSSEGKKLTQESTRKWLRGLSMPDMTHLAMICADLKVRIDWLFTGHGPMRISDTTSWPFRFDVHRYEQLTPGQKIEIEGRLEGAIVDIERAKPAPRRRAG